MRYIFLLITILCINIIKAQPIQIIPQPVSVKPGVGKFQINSKTVLVVSNGVDDNAADFFNKYLKQFYGKQLIKVKSASNNFIKITTLQTLLPGKEGAYTLTVSSTGISIYGQTASVAFAGMQTIIQLLPTTSLLKKNVATSISIPQVSISDYPRFGYRGIHLDCSRHFWPVDFVKKYIDYLALHKFNTFHWHLTDDQGWRIEIKKYPKLTSVGGWRNGTIIGRYPGTGNDNLHYGGFYTQAEIKEIVKYAAQRFITIIPEIEMPGHASAAIAAYPELSCFPNEPTFSFFPKQCVWSGDTTGKQVQQTWGVFDDVFCAGKENTFKVLQDVLDEVLTLFPSRYIHIGGDECPKENWKRCAQCQQRMKDEHLKDEHELQSYFIQRVEKYLNGKGRRIIGWDEILEGGLAPNATVMSWRGEQGGIDAAKQNHDVIMTPGNPVYFDHSQSTNEDSVTIGGYNPIEKVYAYEPIPKELNEDQAKHILGAQANMWAEYMAYPSKVEYHLFPRIAALSEVLWSPKESKSWENFQIRLNTLFKRYDLMKINYSKAYFDLKTSVLPSANYNGVQWKLETKLKSGMIKYQADDNKKISTYLLPVKVNKSSVLKGFFYNGTKLESVVTEKFHFNKATGKKITLTKAASPNYPGDGAFTLVNGVINEKGLGKSREFLGFSGDDCEVEIDLGNITDVKNVIVHGLTEKGSWIYPHKNIELKISNDGENFNDVSFDVATEIVGNQHLRTSLILKDEKTTTRYLKITIRNYGTIPSGMAGAGHKAWLFVDEIEVN